MTVGGVTYQLFTCIHLVADGAKPWVGRIDQIRRWTEDDRKEAIANGSDGANEFVVGDVVIRVTWFLRAQDTGMRKASTADERELFLSSLTDFSKPRAICCGCVVRYVPVDDEYGLDKMRLELEQADEQLRRRDARAGMTQALSARHSSIKSAAASSTSSGGNGYGTNYLEPCSGVRGGGDRDSAPPCTMRHYFFRKWYDSCRKWYDKWYDRKWYARNSHVPPSLLFLVHAQRLQARVFHEQETPLTDSRARSRRR